MSGRDKCERDSPYLVVRQTAGLGEHHLGVVVDPEGRLPMSTDVGPVAFCDHLCDRSRCVEELVG